MNVFIESPGVVLPRNESQVLAGRIHNAFERFSRRIERLQVSLKDVNGPRGGRDKVCLIRIDMAKSGQIIVRERSADMHRAIKSAIRRARALITHELKRGQWQNRRPLMVGGLEASP